MRSADDHLFPVPDVFKERQNSRKENDMQKRSIAFAMAGIAALGILTVSLSGTQSSTLGSWQVDCRHSDAQIVTDGTTEYGKKKIDITLGFARVDGDLKLDDNDPTNSRVDLHIFPATSMAPPIEEDGSFKAHWLANLANQTLVCFHSKKVVRTLDGRIQTTGDLIATRVDRNVEAAPSEAYSGPVYGPPIIHRVVREGTFVFDFPAANGKGQKGGELFASGSTKVFQEDFPQLVKSVVTTYWPPVVQDENCQTGSPGEAYSGPKCTGTFLTPSVPVSPETRPGEDYPGPSDYNSVVGERLTILLHMRLMAKSTGQTVGGN
jgi:polyisoprenoid-binding protein YceI